MTTKNAASVGNRKADLLNEQDLELKDYRQIQRRRYTSPAPVISPYYKLSNGTNNDPDIYRD